jgi:hypothetical protein
MLLWTTVSWMYLNYLPNQIFIQLIVIFIIATEYVYLIQGNVFLKKVFGSHLLNLYIEDEFSMSILIKVTNWGITSSIKLMNHISTDDFYNYNLHIIKSKK